MFQQKIKDAILTSLKTKVGDFQLNRNFDLLEKIIFFNTNNKELDGVKFNWETALNILYDENTSYGEAKKVANLIFNIEPILKKILFICDKTEYEKMVSLKEGLFPLMKYLRIDPQYERPFQTELKIAYELRNLTSHQAADYPRDIFYTNVESCIIAVLYAINNNYKALISTNYYSSSLKVDGYMNEIIEAFRLKNKKYINLDGSEDIKNINTIALEDIDKIDDLDEKNGDIEPRKGEINFLRKNCIPEKRMLMLAEAGMGKTTTMEYLAYCDAKERLENSSKKIPVLLYLNLLVDPKLTIIDYISKKLNISVNDVKNLLVNGEINLFLDGLNEIPNITDLRNARLVEINSLVSNFKNTFIIISTRPQTFNTINDVPKFILLSMNNQKQINFIEKNCSDNECKKIIENTISTNEKIKMVVQTPLFLSIFTKVVVATRQIPKSEGDLVKIFINSLFERETKEKNNLSFDIKKANYLLRSFAYLTKEKYKANSGVIESEIIDCFSEKMKKCSFTVDALDYLSIFIDLGIISHKEGLYYFYHESYQDYFYSEELKYFLGA